jgi:hypothetical protein
MYQRMNGQYGTVVIRQIRPEFKFPAKIEMAFFSNIRHQRMILLNPIVSRSKTKGYKHQQNNKMA